MRAHSTLVRLYRDLRETSRKFQDDNFRAYFLRIARDDFRAFEKKKIPGDSPVLAEFISEQQNNLSVLKRQTVIENFYYRPEFNSKR